MIGRKLFVALLLTSQCLFSQSYHVLFLSSYHPAYSTYHSQLEGIQSAFPKDELELDEEFMDTKRLGEGENVTNFHTYLSAKLNHLPPYDLVITADDNAFHFMKNYGDELFPSLPWVFLGVNDIDAGLAENSNPLSTGILEFVSFDKNIKLIHSQFPASDKIIVIYDATPSSKADFLNFSRALEKNRLFEMVEFDLSHHTFDEMESFLSSQDRGTPLLLLSAFLDCSGNRLDFSECFDRIYRHAQGPIYHLWAHGFGEGVLGGYIVDHRVQGLEAGKLARRILTGESPGNIPVENKSPNHYLFDWRELKKWEIRKGSLPEGSSLINSPVNTRFIKVLALLSGAIIILLFMLMLYHRLNMKLKAANKSLEESRNRFEELFRKNPVIMLLIYPEEGQIIDANKAALSFYGYTEKEILTLTIFDINQLNHSQINREMSRASREKRNYFQFRHQLKDGSIRDVEVFSGNIKLNGKRYLLSAIHDISDKSRLRRELIQREKMNALGFLAGGIAHDFNNLLTGIIGYYDLLMMDDLDEETRKHSLDMIFQSAVKAKDLTGKILTYSRNRDKKRQALLMAELVQQCLEEKAAILPGNIKIKKEFSCSGKIWANSAEVSQIIQNLISNGLQAMERSGGCLTIRINPFSINYQNYKEFKGLSLGKYQLLEVEDQGVGIPKENIQLLFDPYYTTKEMGTGTGLGLALVHSIVEEEEGSIRVDSTPGKGSIFKVYLPAYEE